jgi:hypothetical protein
MIPPTVHAAKYEPENSSIFLCGFIASNLFAMVSFCKLQLLLSQLRSCTVVDRVLPGRVKEPISIGTRKSRRVVVSVAKEPVKRSKLQAVKIASL